MLTPSGQIKIVKKKNTLKTQFGFRLSSATKRVSCKLRKMHFGFQNFIILELWTFLLKILGRIKYIKHLKQELNLCPTQRPYGL